MESRFNRETGAVVRASRRTLIRPYPISVAWPMPVIEKVPLVPETRAQVRAELGLDANLLLGVGVDRLDYTNGIEERLSAVEALLERYPEFRGRFTFVQLAAPSRTKIDPLPSRVGHRLSLLSRSRSVLREPSARRHEFRGQGVRGRLS